MRVAVVDDDPNHLALTRSLLERMRHDCLPYLDGRSFVSAVKPEAFDLLIIDWQLPDLSGPDIVRYVRRELGPRLPILFVTNRSGEDDIVEGLRAGADDFMVKPLRPAEFNARVEALLRRAYPLERVAEIVSGRFRFNVLERTLTSEGRPVELNRKEFELALFLFKNVNRLLTREQLVRSVWGADVDSASRSLDTHVSRLRTKLGLRPETGYRLSAIYNLGYRLESPEAHG